MWGVVKTFTTVVLPKMMGHPMEKYLKILFAMKFEKDTHFDWFVLC